ncbi:MAG: 23S rRNA (uracil(1939)-C(5))-methyltransferase RlmD [Gammaproteobacteria bacterium]|nr:23S rRNA (uracil(1939)-C(5))-methyltransferase RlmD [Gammaproteobacteria bacterium]
MARRRLERSERVRVSELDAEGIGLADSGGFRLRIRGGLPGEDATVKVLRRRRNRLETLAEVIAHPHADRVTPPCPWTARCGGCVLQHLSPAAQRSTKRRRLETLLHEQGVAPPAIWLPDVVGPNAGYRHKARLGVRQVPGRDVMVGFREPASSRVADVEACRILAPALGERLTELKALLGSLTIADAVPQLEIACGDSDFAIILRHLKPLGDGDAERLIEFAVSSGGQIYLQSAGPDSVVRLWPEEGARRLQYTLPDFGLSFAFHPLDFVQVNPAINRQMVALALELLGPTAQDSVLDLFCGIGNFTLPMASRAGSVHGVEGSEALVARAQENLAANRAAVGTSRVTFTAADLYAEDFDVGQLPAADLLLLDPPRSGAENIARGIGKLAPRRAVYVSCHPATLARDARLFADAGYGLTAAGILDMFPHTAHVESIAVFEPRDPG